MTGKQKPILTEELLMFVRLTQFHMVKGIVNAFDHIEFCLALNLTTTSAGGKWAVTWPPIFATRYVSLLPTSCYLQKKS